VSVQPAATVVIPTRARPAHLSVTLDTLTTQAREAGVEVIVVSDGEDPATAAVTAAHDARLITLPQPRGANAARNAGVAAAAAELIVFIDDDVRIPAGWLRALLDGAAAARDHDVFGGPIRAVLEGGGPRACGREPAPITTLDLGTDDRDTALVWSANMAVRASSLRRTGPFDETIFGRGEEEDWLRRNTALGGRVRYLAAAGLEHRRTPADATLPAMARAAHALGRTARRYDLRKGTAPSLTSELRVLAGCLWHSVRRRCAIGLVMAAHSAGRVREAVGR
jgi:GT2 family glycosyltransferase